MTFERIQILNGEIMQSGRTYYLYVVEEDMFTGPALLVAKEEPDGSPHYAKVEVYTYNSLGHRRTRKVKEDDHA